MTALQSKTQSQLKPEVYCNRYIFPHNIQTLLLILIVIFINQSAGAQNKFIIDLAIQNTKAKKVLLTNGYSNLDKTKPTITDTVDLIDGKCTLSGNFKEYGYYSVALDSASKFFVFMIDTGRFSIDYNQKSYSKVIKNSIQNDMMFEIDAGLEPINNKREKYQDTAYMESTTSDRQAIFISKMVSCDSALAEYLHAYITKHKNSSYALNMLNQTFRMSAKSTELAKQSYSLLNSELKNTSTGQFLKSALFDAVHVVVGKSFPKITFLDQGKNKVTLPINHKGIVLIDYWASWCIPCIASLPELRKIKEKYAGKEFQLISISADTNHSLWLKAVTKNNIHWSNYRNLNGFYSKDMTYFSVKAIPFTILIDQGKVILVNPSLDQVDKYVQSKI